MPSCRNTVPLASLVGCMSINENKQIEADMTGAATPSRHVYITYIIYKMSYIRISCNNMQMYNMQMAGIGTERKQLRDADSEEEDGSADAGTNEQPQRQEEVEDDSDHEDEEEEEGSQKTPSGDAEAEKRTEEGRR